MKVLALVSGGKDSCFNMMKCVENGHEIVALAHLKPKDADELDSYMYQSVGHEIIDHYAEAMGLPLFQGHIVGKPYNQASEYEVTEGDEVEDLFELMTRAKEAVDYEAVSVGAIFSDYQRVRVLNVCDRLGVTMLAYLWHCDQSLLLREMVDCGIHAILIKVAALGNFSLALVLSNSVATASDLTSFDSLLLWPHSSGVGKVIQILHFVRQRIRNIVNVKKA